MAKLLDHGIARVLLAQDFDHLGLERGIRRLQHAQQRSRGQVAQRDQHAFDRTVFRGSLRIGQSRDQRRHRGFARLQQGMQGLARVFSSASLKSFTY